MNIYMQIHPLSTMTRPAVSVHIVTVTMISTKCIALRTMMPVLELQIQLDYNLITSG